MKPSTPTFRFYAIFVLLTLIPASWLAKVINDALTGISGPIGQLVSWGVLQPPAVIVIIGVFFLAYERFLWKYPPFNWAHRMPDINGRYEGEGESSFQDGFKYKVVIEIQQTLLTTLVCLYTERASSHSVMANVGRNEHQNQYLAYWYKNAPKTISDDRDMRPHDGFACLEIFEDGLRLEGSYHNDSRERSTFGKLRLSRVPQSRKGKFA